MEEIKECEEESNDIEESKEDQIKFTLLNESDEGQNDIEEVND